MLVTQEMYEAVQKHAVQNYEKGWDVIVECFTIAEIQEEADNSAATDLDSLIQALQEFVDLRNEMAAEAAWA